MRDLIKSKKKLLVLCLLSCLLISSFALLVQSKWITDYQYREMGNHALNLAEIASHSLKLTSQDVKDLESMQFEEILTHPVNQQVSEMFRLTDQGSSIKYAYVIRELSPERITYSVSKEDQDFYENSEGTVLDYIWLLDVIVNDNEQLLVSRTKDYYLDKHRYTHPNADIREVYEKRESAYLLWQDEWGTQIAGLSPLYTVEGEYIGLFGVDIYSSTFYAYRHRVLAIMVSLVAVPMLLASCIYLYLHMRYRRKMSGLACLDSLTGIYNRRGYEENGEKYFQDAQKKQQSLLVIMGDIDHFKIFNDQYGHQEGDRALKLTASTLSYHTEELGGFVARYGGEEFVIVVPGGIEETELLCENIRSQIESMLIFLGDGSQVSITISLGATCCIPTETDNLEMLVMKADHALYQAKHNGRNRYVIE